MAVRGASVADHPEPWREIPNKVVMVTGSSSGLGQEFCLDLAAAGCQIVAAARRGDRLNSLCDQINHTSLASSSIADNRGLRAVAVELDVTADGESIDASIHKAWEAFGRIDVLINNAGFRGTVSTPLNLSEKEWDTAFATNVKGSWLVAKSVCRRMIDAEISGSVINVSSIAGLNRGQLKGSVGYAASKAAVNTMTKIMALELGEHKIRVNSVAPGLFKSEITEVLMQKNWINRVAKRTVPLRTYGTSVPALTSLIRYLIHQSSEYVSGNVFIVDAGQTLPGIPLFSCL